jgi:hypothetical protein
MDGNKLNKKNNEQQAELPEMRLHSCICFRNDFGLYGIKGINNYGKGCG